MFTGLIEAVGTVYSLSPKGKGLTVVISTSSDFLSTFKEGDSISVNGVCSTMYNLNETDFKVDYLEETLEKTTFCHLKENETLNLEACLTLQKPLGGHLVSGHVDTTGTIKQLTFAEPWASITVAFPTSFAHLIIYKGSITIDGISLTICELDDTSFRVELIPHTLKNTNLSSKKEGDNVNLEFDMVGKYLHRFQQCANNHHHEN